MPLGSEWRCLLLQRTTVSRHVHSLGHWGLGTQLDSSWPGKNKNRTEEIEGSQRPERRNDQEGRKDMENSQDEKLSSPAKKKMQKKK